MKAKPIHWERDVPFPVHCLWCGTVRTPLARAKNDEITCLRFTGQRPNSLYLFRNTGEVLIKELRHIRRYSPYWRTATADKHVGVMMALRTEAVFGRRMQELVV